MKIVTRSLLGIVALVGVSVAHGQTRVNVGHVAPFAPVVADTAVSVDVNGTEVLTGVVFNQFSGYLTLSGPGVAPGSTLVEVFAPPGAAAPAITGTFNLAADTDYTVAAIGNGTLQPLALLPLVDDLSAPTAGNVKIRVVHTAPFAASLPDTSVSIRLDGGAVVNGLASVPYGVNSGFFELPAGTYDLQVATPDGSTTLINPGPVPLAAGAVVTLFAVGDGTNQPLGVTAVFADGSFAALPLETGGGGGDPGGGAATPIPTLGAWGLGILALLVAVFAARRFL